MKKLIPLTLLFTASAFAACPDGKTYPVHFTFDDGPHGTLTPRVLDILKQEKVPATFFVLGERFPGGKSNPSNKSNFAILDRTLKEGHRVASHTYSHINHPNFSEKQVYDNIMKPNVILKDYLSPLVRLPYGGGSFRSSNPATQKKNDMVMNTIKKAGMKHIGWDIDTNDWDAKKRPTLLPTLLKDICSKKGGVVLFHDIQRNTVDNLEAWIKAIKKEGHTFHPMEKFHPEAAKPLPPEACGEAPKGKVENFSIEVDDILEKTRK